MPAQHSYNLNVYNAKKFRDSISGPSAANIFFTIGKTTSWANERFPPQAVTSVKAFNEVWSNMIGGKRITGYDVNLCAVRFDWEEGTVYQQYDDSSNDKLLQQTYYNFYVVTDDWNVYKCLFNNNDAPSTEKPESTSLTNSFTTADGYIWKYMYTVLSSDRLRYTTNSFIPISVSHGVIENARPGEISSIVVTNAGSNYAVEDLYVIITGDGYGANAYPVRDSSNNNIVKVVVDNPGRGYTYANATILSSVGTGAATRAVLSPPGGHGSNPYEELGASYVAINPQLDADENGKLITNNDYRQIALIEGPYKYGTTEQTSNTVFDQTITMTVTGISADYQNDEFVYQGVDFGSSTFSATVANWDGANGIIHLANIVGTPKGDVLIGETSTARKFVTSIVYPEMQPRSGRLLYMDNIVPVERAMDQTDSFQIILSF